MQGQSAIALISLLMSRPSLELQAALELVQVLNRSYQECQRVVVILEQVFGRQKSGKILLGVEVLEFLIKNCNKNFHQAANKQSFQRRFLSLLKRLRGKTNFLQDLRSNGDNWNKIEAKVLYLVQLWYDAFILEENTYKILRKENVLFPPRSTNQKNILFVKTQSPILQNIEQIARTDQQKFGKRLNSMGMGQAFSKIQKFQAQQQKKRQTHHIDLDLISEKIAIVRSNSYEGEDMIRLINEVKRDLQFGRVDTSQEKYWKDIKEAAQLLIEEWQQKNTELIQEHQRKYLEMKLGRVASDRQKEKEIKPTVEISVEKRQEPIQRKDAVQKQIVKEEMNLLDL